MTENTHTAHKKSRTSINPVLIGCVFLGICMLIAGLNIGANIKKLNKTISATQFASSNSFNAPSELTYGEKKYLTAEEAADYLNLTAAQVESLIKSGAIKEYIKTDSDYSISVKVLDEWFDNEAYQTKNGYNASANKTEQP